MIEKDYVMRMVERFAAAIAKIVFHKTMKQEHEAKVLIEQAISGLLGLDLALIDTLSFEDLLHLLSGGGELDVDKCAMLGMLLTESGEIMHSENKSVKGDERFLLSLRLHLKILSTGRPTSIGDSAKQVDRLVELLSGKELPPDVLEELFFYWESAGKYAKAEDALFDMVHAGGQAQATAVRNGRAFYQRLLEKEDSDLEEGNLPRSEVVEGLAELTSLNQKQ